jgi:4-carboxymuconolactone decarboxylase
VNSDARAFLEDMVRKRGFVHDFHRVLAEYDLEFLRSYENLLDVAYLRPRRLSRLTKEFVFVGVLASVGAPREHLRAHMMAAAADGATSADILELLELILPPAGVARFIEAIEVWREVFDA